MDLQKANAVGRFEGFLPTKPLAELVVNGCYDVTKIKKVQTKYGSRFIAELNKDFTTFLPARFTKLFEEEENTLASVQEAAASKKLEMIFIGGKYNVVEFKFK